RKAILCAMSATCALACAALCAREAGAESLWKPNEVGYFADHRAHQVGDLLTVLIVESASGNHQATSQTSKENNFSTSGGPGSGGVFKWLGAFGADAKSKNAFSGSGQADVSNKLNARMTVRVTGIDPSGNLIVQGDRTVQVNHDTEDLKLTAVVRPEDI